MAQANTAQANTAQANTAQANTAQANTAQANSAPADAAHANSPHASPAESGYPIRQRPSTNARRRVWLDAAARTLLSIAGAAIVALVLAVAVALLQRTWPILRTQSIGELIGGRAWEPHNGRFGFAPFIIGSLGVTVVAMVLAVAPAVFSGIYLAEYTSRRTRTVIKPALDVLVGLPSVIFGLWGVLAIVPFLREFAGPAGNATGLPWLAFTNPSGYSVLAGGIVLAVMVYPLIVAVVDEVMRSAPQALREALFSLGATPWETTKCIVRTRGRAGILAAVVLGFSRAFGETLAVLMVVGNVPQIPGSLFDGAYPLTALIANNYGEMMSIPLYESALMGAAFLLLVVVILFNIAARGVILRMARGAA